MANFFSGNVNVQPVGRRPAATGNFNLGPALNRPDPIVYPTGGAGGGGGGAAAPAPAKPAAAKPAYQGQATAGTTVTPGHGVHLSPEQVAYINDQIAKTATANAGGAPAASTLSAGAALGGQGSRSGLSGADATGKAGTWDPGDATTPPSFKPSTLSAGAGVGGQGSRAGL